MTVHTYKLYLLERQTVQVKAMLIFKVSTCNKVQHQHIPGDQMPCKLEVLFHYSLPLPPSSIFSPDSPPPSRNALLRLDFPRGTVHIHPRRILILYIYWLTNNITDKKYTTINSYSLTGVTRIYFSSVFLLFQSKWHESETVIIII